MQEKTPKPGQKSPTQIPDLTKSARSTQASYSPSTCLTQAVSEKRQRYGAACDGKAWAFCPFAVSTFGAFARDADRLIQKIGRIAAIRLDSPASDTIAAARRRIAVAIGQGVADQLHQQRQEPEDDDASMLAPFIEAKRRRLDEEEGQADQADHQPAPVAAEGVPAPAAASMDGVSN